MPERERSLREVVPDVDDGDVPLASAEELLGRVARGDEKAFELLYDRLGGAVFGLVRRVVRDHARSEEVTQEVLVEVWRTAGGFDPRRGSASAWVLTMAHRRAVDRVRSAQAAARRDQRAVDLDVVAPFDEVGEQVAGQLERRQVRRCLRTLTEVQRESVLLAYYQGYTCPDVAALLTIPLGTVKTGMRDGLIRLRDCLGVSW